MIVYDSFVAAFPEFGSNTSSTLQSAQVTVGQVNFWIPQAYAQLNTWRFGAQLDLAAMLFVAHNLVLSLRENKANATGQIPGAVQGPIASKSIDKLSISYSGATNLEGAGMWNATTYGQRLFKMMKAYGSGPLYVAGPRRFYR
jgi:hypothetical protein